MSDRHIFTLETDDGWISLGVGCPYDMTDETRPCWPHEEDGSLMPAPQPACNYQEWNENQSLEETIHGQVSIPLNVEVKWDSGFEVHLR